MAMEAFAHMTACWRFVSATDFSRLSGQQHAIIEARFFAADRISA
jgi:hypothetical protein